MQNIKASFLKKDIESGQINPQNVIDIRTSGEWNQYHVDGLTHIDMDELLMDPAKYLKTNQTYYIMCASGMRSFQTTGLLMEHGYTVINVEGGISSYR
ncbi:MAG: rhodanese-like domain-containing protein [Mycoplasmatales bacterium]